MSLKEKMEILATVDNNPARKKCDIAREFGLPASTVNTIVAKREDVQENVLIFDLDRKGVRRANHAELDTAMVGWFKQARLSGTVIDGNMLRERARELAEMLGIEGFKPTNGWVSRFKDRHGLSWNRVAARARTAPRKRKALSLGEKLDILAAVDSNPKRKQCDVAKELGLPASTVNSVLAKRWNVKANVHVFGRERKGARMGKHADLDAAVLDWFKLEVEASGNVVDGVALREKARKIAMDLGIDDFTASNGWVSRFKERHGLNSVARVPRKRNSLSLREKLGILAAVDQDPGRKTMDVAKELGLPVTTVRSIIAKRGDVEVNAVVFNCERKGARMAKHMDLDAAVAEWYRQQCASGANVGGNDLRSQARKVADEFGIEDFTASNGWLQRFKDRYGLSFRKKVTEAAATSSTDSDES